MTETSKPEGSPGNQHNNHLDIRGISAPNIFAGIGNAWRALRADWAHEQSPVENVNLDQPNQDKSPEELQE